MIKRKILLIGLVPPPINGQAVAFQALVNEMSVETLMIPGKRNDNIWAVFIKIFKTYYFV
jgi:hypothetical protein